ncbi:MAG: aspartate--tRNA(Asn) ligase [bacterium]
MPRTHLNELSSLVGKTVEVVGFVQVIRDQGSIKFLRLRDRYGSVQVVILKNHASVFELVDKLTTESVVKITGLVKEANQVAEKIEIEADSIEILSLSAPELPIPVSAQKGGGESDIALRLDWRWLDLRLPEKQQLFSVWTQLEEGFRSYLLKNDFLQLYTPSIMNAPSESGAEVFEVKYFDGLAYLAQSPQFFKQMAMASGLERVFMTGPVFRAELSFTTRHMTEFTGWDFEFSYIDSHHDVMDMEEGALIAGLSNVKTHVLPDLVIPKTPFPRIVFSEAKAMLKKAGIESEKPFDFSPLEERELGKIVEKEHKSEFFFVIDYPIEGRAFYHMRHADNPKLTKGFDLFYKGLEVTTGAQREHRIDVLETQAKEKGLTLASIADYLNFFRFGCPPHGGVGIGPGRIVAQILNLPSVKEATFLPRDVKRIRP